jgi:hypothetical protein
VETAATPLAACEQSSVHALANVQLVYSRRRCVATHCNSCRCSELAEDPKVLVAALPTDPAEYRRTESVAMGPKPRTRKMIGMISGSSRPLVARPQKSARLQSVA